MCYIYVCMYVYIMCVNLWQNKTLCLHTGTTWVPMQTHYVLVSGHHIYVHQPWVVFSLSVKQTKQLCGLGRATRASIDTTASRLPGEISISHKQSFSKVNVRVSKRRAFSRQPSACFDIWPPRGPPFFFSLFFFFHSPWSQQLPGALVSSQRMCGAAATQKPRRFIFC